MRNNKEVREEKKKCDDVTAVKLTISLLSVSVLAEGAACGLRGPV